MNEGNAGGRKAEERWAFQLMLADRLRSLATPQEVQAKACEMLGVHLGLNRVHLAEIEGDEFVIRASYVNDVAPLPPRGWIATFGAGLLESYRRGQPVAVGDVERDPRFSPAERATLRAAGIAAFAGAILTRDGKWVATLGAHSVRPRVWAPDEIATITQVADRVWTAVERAKVETALRESEERYAAIFERSPIAHKLTRLSDRVTVSANPAFLRMFEMTAEEVIGHSNVELGISNPEAQAQALAELLSRGSVRDLECTRVGKSGAARTLMLNMDWVIVNGDKHVLTTIRDVTDLRRAEAALRAHEQERLVEQARAEGLRHSESKYAGILRAAAEAIVSVDEQQRITTFNEAAEQTFGYTQAEAIGAPLDILLPVGLRAAHRAHVARFAASDEANRVVMSRAAQLVGRRRDGEEFPVDAMISKVTIDGQQTILTAALRDITAKRRTEIEQRLLSEIGRALAARIDDDLALATLTKLAVREFADLATLFLLGEDGSVQRRGVAARDSAREWLVGLMMSLPVDRRAEHPLWQTLETRQSRLIQVDAGKLASYALSDEHGRALETLKPRSVIGVPLVSGEDLFGAVFVAACWPSRAFDDRDVLLLEEVARRTALSLQNVRHYRMAKNAIRARDEVLGVVAHDLRGPLGTILMHAALAGPEPGQVERRSQRHAEAITRSVSQMSRLISDLLDVTQMEAGHLKLDRAPLVPRDILLEVVEVHRDRALPAAIELRVEAGDDLPGASADKGRLFQVFENLIGNAVRAVSRGSISLAARAMGGEVLFSVSDTGTGIAPEDLAHVFDRFWQAPATRSGRAGLGLSIVKAIVEVHGGRTWIESKLGEGTTVFFTVPAVRSPS